MAFAAAAGDVWMSKAGVLAEYVAMEEGVAAASTTPMTAPLALAAALLGALSASTAVEPNALDPKERFDRDVSQVRVTPFLSIPGLPSHRPFLGA